MTEVVGQPADCPPHASVSYTRPEGLASSLARRRASPSAWSRLRGPFWLSEPLVSPLRPCGSFGPGEPLNTANCLPPLVSAGKVELHGKLVEVEHSVPKRQR